MKIDTNHRTVIRFNKVKLKTRATQMIWIKTFWFDSCMIQFKETWIQSNSHDPQMPRPKRKSDMIQTILNRIKHLEN